MSKQYVRNPDGSLELTRPKTENSVRLLSIPQTAVDLLIKDTPSTRTAPTCSPRPSPERCTTRQRGEPPQEDLEGRWAGAPQIP